VTRLGLVGTMLCGRTRAKNLDHPDFLPLLQTATRLGVPLFVHPQIPQRAVREVYYSGFSDLIDTAFATFALGWHYEAGIQFVRLILAGVFDKYPDLQIILGHWGEVVLFYLERLNSLGRVAHLQRPIADYIRQNLYVTPSGMWSQPYLQRTLELVGPERILFSTDYPYQYRPGGPGRSFIEEASLSLSGAEGTVCSRELGAADWINTPNLTRLNVKERTMPTADRWRQADLSVSIVVHETIASGWYSQRRSTLAVRMPFSVKAGRALGPETSPRRAVDEHHVCAPVKAAQTPFPGTKCRAVLRLSRITQEKWDQSH
jgi:hypothetical protein